MLPPPAVVLMHTLVVIAASRANPEQKIRVHT